MDLEASNVLRLGAQAATPGRRTLFLGLFFVLAWPGFNLLVLAAIMLQFNAFDGALLAAVAVRLFSLFSATFALIQLLQRLFPVALAEDRFWPQLLIHVLAIVLIVQAFSPVVPKPDLSELPQPSILPTIYLFFQVTLYVAVKTLLVQRDRYLAAQVNLRQAQINLLRSQTNPHFLFNTLNLLAAEIVREPETAREIVYDLADLLRDSMRAAEREFTTLDEELRLIGLYLALQQKRFPERLAYSLEIDESCRRISIPSLLLQPVVENVIKHVVSRSSEVTYLEVAASIEDGNLRISVSDNHPGPSSLNPSGGLRIVQQTLALHYRGRAELALKSDSSGSEVSIRLPLQASDH